MTTIKLAEVAADDDKYIAGDSRIAIESLPAEAWTALLEAAEELNGAGSVPGMDCQVAKTNETLADFDDSRAQHWTEAGRRTEHTFDGRPAVHFERIQMFKGQTRLSMIVVDCGDCRAALSL